MRGCGEQSRIFDYSMASPVPNTMKQLALKIAAGWLAALTFSAPAAIVTEVTNSTTSLAFAASASAVDLIDASQVTLASAVLPTSHSSFSSAGLHDGIGNSTAVGGNTFFDAPAHLPATATFNLNVTASTNGYNITALRTICGWATVSQSQANQKYDIYIQKVGGVGFTLLTNVDYSPFPTSSGTAYESQVTVTNDSGVLASNVSAIQFVFQVPTVSGGSFPGTVYREVDVFGAPSTTNPPPVNSVSITAPKTRQIVQRNAGNVANLVVQGTFAGSATRLEARALVMPGVTNNGVATDWITIVSTPTNGVYTGTISNLTAGGWYRVEVRAVDVATNVLASAVVERVGVGDLIVTTGQSNAGCFGSPTQTPGDDRASAYTLASGNWQFAADPQPNISGFMGTGGSAWPILGTRLIHSNAVPVGLIGLAYGATTVGQWAPGTTLYQNLTNTLVRFGPNGVRVVLWHQGESDSLVPTPAATYAQQLTNLIVRSRLAAGWSVPWGIAEATFHPSATRAAEEAVAAGQRQGLYHLTNCFRGPRTDDFNLEGKISAHDGANVHFNALGLTDHAQQWANALAGIQNLTPKNGDFEANLPLNDGIGSYGNRVIGWNRLGNTGVTLASGSNGYLNPGAGQYSNAVDTINGGVLPNMSGKHVGTLTASAVSNVFLQTLNARLQPSTIYTFTLALGVRDNAEVFGGYRLDLLANGVPLGTGVSGNLGNLSALAGGDAVGKFTTVSCVYTSAVAVATNQQLAIRIMKTGGSGTYLDFDNAQVTSQLSGYGQWQMTNWGSVFAVASLPAANPDSDPAPNLIEYLVAGLNPLAPDPVMLPTMVSLSGEDYLQFLLNKTPPPVFGTVGVEMSLDLANWFAPTNSADIIVTDDATQYRVQLRRATIPQSFFRIVARLP